MRVLPVYARPFNRAARADTTRWTEAPARLPALAVRQGQPTRFEGAATLLSAYLVCLEVWHQKAALAYAISVRVERTSPSPTRPSASRASQDLCAPRARRLRCRVRRAASATPPTSPPSQSAHLALLAPPVPLDLSCRHRARLAPSARRLAHQSAPRAAAGRISPSPTRPSACRASQDLCAPGDLLWHGRVPADAFRTHPACMSRISAS